MSPGDPTPHPSDSVPPTLSPAAAAFLARRSLATLTTLRGDGRPHVVPVGFTYDPTTGLARVITSGTSVKVANVESDPRVALCQVDGPDWLTLEGHAQVRREPDRVAEGVRRYAERYRTPRDNPTRVVLEVDVHRVLGSRSLTSPEQPE